ncbi:MAG: dockerin type I domain-containing protein, partial [Myxococcota bacterium]
MLQGAVCAIALMMLAPPATAQSQFNGAGDLNDDGTIDMEDVRLMMQIIKGEIALDNLTLELADIAPVADRDSEVNANDLAVLMRAVGNDDFDGDGRDNDDELTDGFGENPFLADTDGDGLTDGEEFDHLPSRTDPTNPD